MATQTTLFSYENDEKRLIDSMEVLSINASLNDGEAITAELHVSDVGIIKKGISVEVFPKFRFDIFHKGAKSRHKVNDANHSDIASALKIGKTDIDLLELMVNSVSSSEGDRTGLAIAISIVEQNRLNAGVRDSLLQSQKNNRL